MSSNVFANNAVSFVNAAPAAQFEMELDGISNGVAFDFTNPQIIGGVTPRPFGSTCEPAIAATTTAFEALGFPPLN